MVVVTVMMMTTTMMVMMMMWWVVTVVVAVVVVVVMVETNVPSDQGPCRDIARQVVEDYPDTRRWSWRWWW